MTAARKPLCFALVANVAPEVFGHGGPSAGTKHFSAGAKVYCEPPHWGDGGERLWVVGRHRGSPRFIRIIIPSNRLVNWRVQGVYNTAVVNLLKSTWPNKSTAARWAASANASRKTFDNVQAAGKLVTRAYRQLDAGGPSIAKLEQEAAAALASFTADDWKREPRGPAALQVLGDWLEDRGALLASEELASMVTRRARRREEVERRGKRTRASGEG